MSESRKFGHVLLAEDDDDHAELVMFTLSRAGLDGKIERVRDGEEALLYLHSRGQYENRPRPCLVLLDLKMPRLGGLEVLAERSQEPELREIPVVVMSTSNAEQDRKQAYAFGANGYVVKPMEFDAYDQLLNDIVRFWCGWNQTVDSTTRDY